MRRDPRPALASLALGLWLWLAPATLAQVADPAQPQQPQAPGAPDAPAPDAGKAGSGAGGPAPDASGGATSEADDADVASTYLPVPDARAAEVAPAARQLRERVQRVRPSGELTPKLSCWLQKLEGAGADDGVIEWTRICPALPTGPAKPSSICEEFAVNELQLYELVRTSGDVEKANNQLHFIAHVKAEVLELQTSFPEKERDEFVVAALERLVRDVRKASQELDAMAASSERGGIPRHYRAIREWIGQKQNDEHSLYKECS